MMVVTVPLPPSKTYKSRTATLVTVTDDSGRCRAMVLEVREWNRPASVHTSRYALREESLPNDPHNRAFLLKRRKDDVGEGEAGHYNVLLDCVGDLHQCECVGFEAGGTCKHIQALVAMRDRGHLTPGGTRC